MMNTQKIDLSQIKAIGFDLFNTLITAQPEGVSEAVARLLNSLQRQGFALEEEKFKKAYRESAVRIIKETRKHGRETHNRFWVSAALQLLGYDVGPEDPRIAASIDAYFSAFMEYCHVIPGTFEMLNRLNGSYRLALLSNFTHPPAAEQLINGLGLTPFFDFILISGDLGYRKPHPFVFQRLAEGFGLPNHDILYVGDDPEPDINGSVRAGLQAVWFTYTRDHHIPTVPGVAPSGPEQPEFQVPRVSTWENFLFLLGVNN